MATWQDNPAGYFGIATNTYNAKTLPFSTEGIGAANYGINLNNVNTLAQRLFAERAQKSGGSKSIYDAALKWSTNQGLTDVSSALGSGNFSNVNANNLLRAYDFALRETARAQQHKSTSFFSKLGGLVKSALPAIAGAAVLGPAGAGLTSAAAGGAVGGAIAGGVKNGPLGAVTGGLSGYGIGAGFNSAYNWATNAPINNVNSLVGGSYAAHAASGVPTALQVGSGATAAAGGSNMAGWFNTAANAFGSASSFLKSNPWIVDAAGAGLNYWGSQQALNAQSKAAERAFEQAQFRPYSISGPLGSSSFNGTTATGTLSPEMLAESNRLRAMTDQARQDYTQFDPNNYGKNVYQTLSDYGATDRMNAIDQTMSDMYNAGQWRSTTGANTMYSLERARQEEDRAFRLQALQASQQEQGRLFDRYISSLGAFQSINQIPYDLINQGLSGGQSAATANVNAAQYPWKAAQTESDATSAFWQSLATSASRWARSNTNNAAVRANNYSWNPSMNVGSLGPVDATFLYPGVR